MRFNAAVLPNRRHPIIVVGDRLLEQPAALAYVLAHERNHVRRPWLQVYFLLQLVIVAGFPGMGLVLPWRVLVIVAPAVWAATMLLSWVNELAADVAARTTGPEGARSFWAMRRAARPTRTGLSRLTGALATVLAPTHPPMALRAALADRIAHRPLP
jgi:Zn-dependent protease with chaperone function